MLRRQLTGRRRNKHTERVLFALVADGPWRPPRSRRLTLGLQRYAHRGLDGTTDDACYRVMDWLLEIQGSLEREVFHLVASLLNLEVDLLFFDTTSTYFCTDEADEPVARNEHGEPTAGGPEEAASLAGFRCYGHSKDHRSDLPQVVVGMAVTREGIPVRVWSWPGNTADTSLIGQVKEELREWTLGRVVWVADRGFASAANRRLLRRGCDHYIMAEKLRGGSAEATAALARAGRYAELAGGLRVKEVRVSKEERFVVCHNPEAARRDAAVREHARPPRGDDRLK